MANELSLALIDTKTQIEVQDVIREVDKFDEVLKGKTEAEQYARLMEAAHVMAGFHGAAAVALRMTLWQIRKRELWALPNENGEKYPDFESWVEGEVRPFVNEHADFSPGYLGDAVRAITRMGYYLYLHPVFHPETQERITPEEFLAKAPARTVKMVSQVMLQDPGKHGSRPDLNQTPEKDELIQDILTMSSSKVTDKWIEHDNKKLYYQATILTSGDVNVFFPKLPPQDYALLLALLGDIGEEISG
jgi:hypothetical protein